MGSRGLVVSPCGSTARDGSDFKTLRHCLKRHFNERNAGREVNRVYPSLTKEKSLFLLFSRDVHVVHQDPKRSNPIIRSFSGVVAKDAESWKIWMGSRTSWI